MAELALVLAVAVALIAPHLLSLERVAPTAAAATWLGVLTLRALVVLALVLTTLATVPGSAAFHAIVDASLRVPLPAASDPLEISGHSLAHLIVLAPAAALIGTLLAFCASTARAMLGLRREISTSAVGEGPSGSVLVADPAVTVALPVLGAPRPIVSRGALASLDDAELSATIAHEIGHARRRHRPLRIAGAALAHVASALPGTRAAEGGLRLSLERDADEFAVRQTGEPLGLASAICKAAGSQLPRQAAVGIAEPVATHVRLEQLLAGGRQRGGPWRESTARVLAVSVGVACCALAAAVVTVLAPPSALARGIELALHCPG